MASALGLNNVTPVCSRTEAIKDRKYDYVVSRAVTELSKFIPLTRHLYTEGILYLKGGDVRQEIDDCIRKCRIAPDQVSVHEISGFFEEEFFESKKIICIFKQKH